MTVGRWCGAERPRRQDAFDSFDSGKIFRQLEGIYFDEGEMQTINT
jgi:hypothetical protein